MSTKFVRVITALAIMVSIIGNTGVARANHGAPPSVGAQNLEQPRVPEPQPLDSPALTIPAASSLGVQFVHVVTAANIYASYSSIIDHPLTNGDPNAIILVTPNYNPGGVGAMYDNHPIGVWYNTLTSKWMIFNQDLVAMPVGAAFNVIIPTAGANVFVHTATFVYGNHTFINNALTDGNPNAIILVTPNYGPGGVCPCVYANFPIGVYYDTAWIGGKWAILNQTVGAMPVNASFNVFILTAGAGIFVHTATAGNSTGNYTTIDNALTNGNPNAIVFAMPNWNSGGGTYNNHNIGVFYSANRWRIFNQDIAAIPLNAAFNVLVLVPSSDIFVHKATMENSAGDYTTIDKALTNGNPNAIILVTPNYNPGGITGAFDNHLLGVYYNNSASQWTIFNQDLAAMSVNAAFNVFVPNPDTSVFVHKTTEILSNHYTMIDYPLTNGNQNAIIFVTPNWNPGGVGGMYDNHPIGVFYAGSRWFIFNQDNEVMPVNAAFNVFVPAAGPGVFVHTATAANINGGSVTIIDNALTNGNPNAIILVTPNYNPGGVGGTYDNAPINVFYTGTKKWAIFHPNLEAIQVGAAFNVYVVGNYKNYLPLILR